MAHAFVQLVENSTVSAGTSIATGALASVVAGNVLTVWVNYNSTAQRTVTLSDTRGLTWTKNIDYWDGTESLGEVVFTASVGSSGAENITATFDTSVPASAITAREDSGLDSVQGVAPTSTTFNRQATPGTSADAVTSTNYNVASQPAVLMGMSFNATAGGGAPSAGTGMTSRGTIWTFGGLFSATGRIADKRVTAAGNAASTFTAGANQVHLTAQVVWTEASAGGVKRNTLMLMGLGR